MPNFAEEVDTVYNSYQHYMQVLISIELDKLDI